MTIERDGEFEDWPAEADPIRGAIGQLLVVIIENTVEGSSERARAMTEALEAYGRIKAAMVDRPRLN
jgi:hypothetical protein